MAEKTQAYYYIGTGSGVYTKVYDGKKLQADLLTYEGYKDKDSFQAQITDGNISHVNQYGTMVYDEDLKKFKGTLDLHYDEGYPKVFRDGVDVTDQYDQTQVADPTFEDKTPGCKTFTIIARDITLQSATISKEYDGTALTAYSNPPGGGTVITDLTSGQTDKGYVSGEEFNYTFTGEQVFVGESDNVFTVANNESTKTQISDYNVTKQYGKLIVTPRTSPLTITVNDQERLYDGTASIDTKDYTVTGDLASGDTITVTLTNKDGSINAGTYTDGITATYKIMHGDVDVTDMYANVTVNAGDLVIDKRAVTITSGTATKAYDGTPLTKNSTEITAGDGFVGGEYYVAKVTGSQTEVGESKNYFTVSAAEGTNLNNYNITKIEGTLTVTPAAAITITANSKEKMYDGKALTDGGYTYTGTLNAGDYLSVTVTGSITDYGTATNKVSSYKIYNKDGKDVTKSYAQAELKDGTLSITKRDVVLTSGDATKKYDGAPLSNHNVTVTGSGFVDGQGATYTVTGSQTAVGSSANYFTYDLNSNTKADNYSISTALGTLTVTPNDTLITITADSNSKMYDGTSLSDSGYTYTGKLAAGDYFDSVTVIGEQTHYGEAANKVTDYVIKNQAGENVTSFYTNVKKENGTLSITKRDVTLTSASDSKKYDGTPLTNNNVSVTGSGFVSGEGATYNVTGSQTEVGSSKNYFSYDLNQGTWEEDYSITTKDGTLTVYNADAITITANDASKKYDGTALTEEGFTVTGKLAAGDKVEDVVITSSITDAGNTANQITSYKIMHDNGDGTYTDVTGSYAKAKLVDGTLTVTKRDVTLTSDSDSKKYDGTPLTNYNVTVSGDDFVGTEGATYTVTGSQTEPGTSKNTFTYTLNNDTKEQNYNITTKFGDLTVNKADVTITIGVDLETGLTYLYDGTATKTLTESQYQVSGLAKDDKLVNVTITTDSANAGVYEDYTLTYDIVNAAGESVKDYYSITEIKNDVEITRRSITIQAGSASKVYDGTALTCDDWAPAEGGDGLADGEKIDGVKMTEDSTQTHVGSTANKVDPSGVTITKADGSDSSMNYVVDTLDGTLTVTKRYVLLISTSADKYYDGTALQNRQVIVTGLSYLEGKPVQGEGFLPGDGCTYDFVGDDKVIDAQGNVIMWTVSEQSDTAYGQTDVGSSKNEFNYKNFTSVYFDSKETDYEIIYGNNIPQWFTDKYGEIVADNLFGDLTVWGGPVEINMTDYSWTYDYQAKNYGYFDDGYSVVFTTKEDGSGKETTTFTHNDEGQAVALFGNDEIVVTVTGQGGSAATGKVQHVSDGTKQNEASYKIYRDGKDVTEEVKDYYLISIDGGELKITPRTVVLESGTAYKKYDGTALTDNTVTEGSEGRLAGFIFGEGAAYEVTGSQTEVGSSKNTIKISQLLTNTQPEDYNFIFKEGVLTVNKDGSEPEITISVNDYTKSYDGTNDLSGVTFTTNAEDILLAGDNLYISVSTDAVDAGTGTIKIDSIKIMRGDLDVTSVYSFGEIEGGNITINPRKVTLTSGSAVKVYDGTPLTNDTITVSGEGFAGTDGVYCYVTGSQTEIGSSKNTFAYILSEGTKAANYNITKVEGILTVKEGSEPTPTVKSLVVDTDTTLTSDKSYRSITVKGGAKLTVDASIDTAKLTVAGSKVAVTGGSLDVSGTATISGTSTLTGILDAEAVAINAKADVKAGTLNTGKVTLSSGAGLTADVIELGEGANTVAVGAKASATVGTISGVSKLTLSSGATMKVTDAYTGTAAKDTMSIGSGATFEAGIVDLDEGANAITVSGKADVTIGELEGTLNKLTLSSGTANDKTTFAADKITGTDAADKLSIGSNAVVKISDNIELAEGNDTIAVGKFSKFEAGTVDFGAGTGDKFTAGYQSDVKLESVVDVNQFVTQYGTADSMTKVDIAGGIEFSAKTTSTGNKLTIAKYTDMKVHDLIDFNGQKTTISVGNNSKVVLRADDASTVTKFTIGSGATAYLSGALYDAVTSKAADATVINLDAEMADNSFANAKLLGDTYDGWLNSEYDNVDYLKTGSEGANIVFGDNYENIQYKYGADGEWQNLTSGTLDLAADTTIGIRVADSSLGATATYVYRADRPK